MFWQRHGKIWRWVAVLVLLLQGAFDLVPVAAGVVTTAAPPVITALPQSLSRSLSRSLPERDLSLLKLETEPAEAENHASCSCRMCSTGGGKPCCCSTAETVAEQICFQAVCDTPMETTPGVPATPRALPGIVRLPQVVLTEIQNRFHRRSCSPGGRTPETPELPPCLPG